MSNSKFGFLPFLRKGLAKNITVADGGLSIAGSPPERAVVPVTVKVDTPAPGSPAVTQQVQLVGPGDILSIARDVVLRTEPANYVFNFESNMLPFVEFYEEDFLWRYSPAKEDAGKKLRPWLALIVLKNSEFVLKPPVKDGLPGFIEPASGFDFDTVLHPNLEHWAWGHVQLNQPDDTNPIQVLKSTAESKPDSVVCRLLSSRQLEPDTEYTAFLIPAFETGRLAGFGAGTASVKSLLGSWDYSGQGQGGYATPAPPFNKSYPVYLQWRFATSALGDFESLARKLKPVELDSAVGTRLLDVRRLGMGLEQEAAAVPNPLDPGNTAKNGTVNLEGALSPAGSSYSASQNATPSGSSTAQNVLTGALKDVLNLQTDLQQIIVQGSNLYGLGSYDEDPVILPPLYGQYHADAERVSQGAPLWFQEANLDLRNRAAAGLGVQVIRENQEQFMELAWRQVGEVNAANEKIRKAQLAIAASKAIYEKHLVGKIDGSTNSTTATTPDKFERVLKIASPALKKVQTGNAGIVSLVNNYLGLTNSPNPLGKVALQTTAGSTAVTGGTVDSGFRKMARNRSAKVRVADRNTQALVQGLQKNLDASANVKAAGTFTSPVGSQNQQQFAANVVVAVNNPSNVVGASMAAYPVSNATQPADWVKYNKSQFDDFWKTYNYYKDLDAKDNPQRKSLIVQGQSHAFRKTIQDKLDPEVSVKGRVLAQIKLNAPGALNKVKPILAYPVIDLPMVNDLTALSVQHLAPNLGEIPANSVTLLESNDRFIESYMLGLNHEFNRELLWREYPTDQRGSSFRVFWDKKDDLSGAAIDDIWPVHQWPSGSHLGGNSFNGAQNIMVLCVRGDLLKKFPNALIYAQKAAFGASASSPRTLVNAINYSNAFDPLTGNLVSADIKTPVFRMDVQPDLVMLGFRLSKEEANGVPANFPNNADAGWFFVFRERPGNIRFGLDAAAAVSPPPLTNSSSWDMLSWNHLDPGGIAANVKFIRQSSTAPSLSVTPQTVPVGQSVHWNGDAAQNAYILYRRPSLVAIHADNMINA